MQLWGRVMIKKRLDEGIGGFWGMGWDGGGAGLGGEIRKIGT